MKHKSISTQSGELLAFFNELGKPCFNYAEAYEAIPNSKDEAVRKLLSDMTKRGLLMRLKGGVYYIIPYEQNAESFVPDWYLLAEYLVSSADHYIGYYSALQIHNLITQPSLKEQIVVLKYRSGDSSSEAYRESCAASPVSNISLRACYEL